MIKGFLLKGRRGRERTWEEREGWEGKGGEEGAAAGGNLAPRSQGDRRPCQSACYTGMDFMLRLARRDYTAGRHLAPLQTCTDQREI